MGGKVKIKWLDQAGFLVEAGGVRAVFDPYLSNSLGHLKGYSRMVPPALAYGDLNCDIVAFTHDHLDHYDPESVKNIYPLYPKCRYVGPVSTFDHFVKDGFDKSRFVKMVRGGTYILKGLTLRAVKADHTEPRALGYVIEADGRRIYLSGDTYYNAQIIPDVRRLGPLDLAIICINGKYGNMNDLEAVRLMHEIGAPKAVPMHYGLFKDNTCSPLRFAEGVSKFGIKPLVLQHAEEIVV